MLTKIEKENLYHIIVSSIGEDATIKMYRNGFNERTAEVVEDMLSADSKCNKNMKKLVMDLSKGSSTIAKGWLKRALKINTKLIKDIDFKGYGCLVSVKSRWKTAIISSAI